MSSRVLLLAVLPLLSESITYDEGAPAGVYENYVFAMEWQPQWSQPPYCDETLAANLSPSAYAATHWSLHGLWPNYDPDQHDGMSWPQFCVRDNGENYTKCDGNYDAETYCNPSDAIEALNTTEAWQKFALEYSWSDLASHEWSKHGSCSPSAWDSTTFFGVAQDKFDELVDGVGGAFVTANVGKTVAKADLVAAFQTDTDGSRVVFNCDGECNLSEVWTAWNLDADTMLPTTAKDYGDDEPCSSSCTELNILDWTNVGDCPIVVYDDDTTECVENEHGPYCESDDDCVDVPGCVRCASSSFCTTVPL
jgi:ribonuclease I